MENVKKKGQNYILLTSQTKEPITCPDNDLIARKINDNEVELTFLKKIKVTRV